jgi:hypothetical protein
MYSKPFCTQLQNAFVPLPSEAYVYTPLFYETCINHDFVHVVRVDGVRLSLNCRHHLQVREAQWNVIYRGGPKNSDRNLSTCDFVHYKFHME